MLIDSVIACEAERGWLVTLDHGGVKLNSEMPVHQRLELINSYARMQAGFKGNSDLEVCLPKAEGSKLLTSLLDFLGTGGSASSERHRVGAAYFLGSRQAKDFHLALDRRRAILEQHVVAASDLPDTVNHSDLRPTNAAIKLSGECVLFSWNDAVYGPAGLSLHSLFSGCLTPNRLLLDPEGTSVIERMGHHRRILDRYIDALVRGNYADEISLHRCLPASITVGVMQYLVNFAKYPNVNTEDRETIRQNLERRLEDLLNLCDFLCSRSRQSALEFADDHRQAGRSRRAQRVLEAYLADHPTDAIAIGHLASVLAERDRVGRALRTCRRAIAAAPEQAQLHERMGLILMNEMDYREAVPCFRRAVELDPNCASSRGYEEQAVRMQRSWDRIRSLNGEQSHVKRRAAKEP